MTLPLSYCWHILHQFHTDQQEGFINRNDDGDEDSDDDGDDDDNDDNNNNNNNIPLEYRDKCT
jgi:hypothetical protein